jgi:hypothetical protein
MENAELVTKIKEWLVVDDEINVLSETMKMKKKTKKSLTDILMETMKTKDIEVVNLNGGGAIELKKNKVKSSLNKKNLIQCLNEYFNSEEEKHKVNEIVQHIMSNRNEKVNEFIKRTN